MVDGERNAVMETLLQRGINSRPGTHAIHMQSYYRKRFGLRPDDFPLSRDADAQSMALPLHNRMQAEDFEHVVRTLRSI
jgi:dTDP-4-amino-4,6-dideoxygalactose transaminase